MTVIACGKCCQEKAVSEFHKNSAAPGGLRLECKSCRRLKAIEEYKADPESSKERAVKYARLHPEKAKAANRRYAGANIEKRRKVCRDWQKKNLDLDAERSASQRAAVGRATPSWANRKYIQLFYTMAKLEEERTGKQVHVDHIYPLNSEFVCGLHVEDNLQLLFAEDNIRKSNQLYGGGLSL